MAVYAKHSASAPPSAPIREKAGHLLLRGYCILVLFTAMTAGAWNNLLGPIGLTVWVAVLALASVLLWIRPPLQPGDDRPRFTWRRLPWIALAYVGWAGVSILWSAWPAVTALTWFLLAATTLQALFVASVLTWRELVRAIASALKWVLGLSLVFELIISLVVHGPVLPLWVDVPADIPAELYWSRDNLFDGGRIQGIVGNANLLAILALMGVIVFAIRWWVQSPRRGWLIAWIVLSLYLMVRANSATAWLAAIGVVIVLATALAMRSATRPGERTRWYVLYAVVGIGGGLTVWLLRDVLFSSLGRSSDLTGREQIWDTVLAKAGEHPVIGWGYATPWLPWDPAFDSWIVDHDLTVFHAHSVWVDVFFQLGAIGLVLIVCVFLALTWRTWFFAVDRPRWDLRRDRPYSALTLLPTLTVTVLLVQSVVESRPLMEWGWLFIALFAFKIKQSPHIGQGPTEERIAIERGEMPKQAV